MTRKISRVAARRYWKNQLRSFNNKRMVSPRYINVDIHVTDRINSIINSSIKHGDIDYTSSTVVHMTDQTLKMSWQSTLGEVILVFKRTDGDWYISKMRTSVLLLHLIHHKFQNDIGEFICTVLTSDSNTVEVMVENNAIAVIPSILTVTLVVGLLAYVIAKMVI